MNPTYTSFEYAGHTLMAVVDLEEQRLMGVTVKTVADAIGKDNKSPSLFIKSVQGKKLGLSLAEDIQTIDPPSYEDGRFKDGGTHWTLVSERAINEYWGYWARKGDIEANALIGAIVRESLERAALESASIVQTPEEREVKRKQTYRELLTLYIRAYLNKRHDPDALDASGFHEASDTLKEAVFAYVDVKNYDKAIKDLQALAKERPYMKAYFLQEAARDKRNRDSRLETLRSLAKELKVPFSMFNSI